MNSCGRGCTLFRREEVRPQKRLFCDGKLVDYKRREVGRLRGKYSRRRDGGRQSRTALCFACLRHGKRAASPHPAALAYSLRRLTPPPPSRGRLTEFSSSRVPLAPSLRELSALLTEGVLIASLRLGHSAFNQVPCTPGLVSPSDKLKFIEILSRRHPTFRHF